MLSEASNALNVACVYRVFVCISLTHHTRNSLEMSATVHRYMQRTHTHMRNIRDSCEFCENCRMCHCTVVNLLGRKSLFCASCSRIHSHRHRRSSKSPHPYRAFSSAALAATVLRALKNSQIIRIPVRQYVTTNSVDIHNRSSIQQPFPFNSVRALRTKRS